MDRRSKGSPGTKEDLVATTGPAAFRELVAAISAKCKLGKVGELETREDEMHKPTTAGSTASTGRPQATETNMQALPIWPTRGENAICCADVCPLPTCTSATERYHSRDSPLVLHSNHCFDKTIHRNDGPLMTDLDASWIHHHSFCCS